MRDERWILTNLTRHARDLGTNPEANRCLLSQWFLAISPRPETDAAPGSLIIERALCRHGKSAGARSLTLDKRLRCEWECEVPCDEWRRRKYHCTQEFSAAHRRPRIVNRSNCVIHARRWFRRETQHAINIRVMRYILRYLSLIEVLGAFSGDFSGCAYVKNLCEKSSGHAVNWKLGKPYRRFY